MLSEVYILNSRREMLKLKQGKPPPPKKKKKKKKNVPNWLQLPLYVRNKYTLK